jgi:hypothetical protein
MEPHVNPSILFHGVMMVNEEQGQLYPCLSPILHGKVLIKDPSTQGRYFLFSVEDTNSV